MSNDYLHSLKRASLVAVIALTCFFCLELALQVRSHIRYGQSILNALSGETTYFFDEKTGLKLLRPNSRFEGSQATIVSNSLGLRGPEIPVDRAPGGIRLAILGASSVMGAYATSNEVTLSELLRTTLSEKLGYSRIEVINAGIAGATLHDQRIMLEKVVAPLHPDMVLLYPGFNDFARYCRRSPGVTRKSYGLPTLELPKHLLTIDLLLKNTEILRRVQIGRAQTVDPASIDYSVFETHLADLLDTAGSLKIPIVVATNARAYRRDQPLKEQQELSHTARYFNHCFDLAGLHDIHDRHNDLLETAARKRRLPLLRLDKMIPGGSRYFADSSHFSEAGERLAAQHLATFLVRKQLLRAPSGHESAQ